MDVTKAEDKRVRQVTLSLLADTITEEEIQEVFDNWSVGIKGGAYCLHDKDTYNAKEVKKYNERVDEKIAYYESLDDDESIEKVKELENSKIEVGQDKPAHYHILMNFGKSPRTLGDIARAFKTEVNMVEVVSRGMTGFAAMMAYLTHNTTNAQKDGKYVYDTDIVKNVVFPKVPLFEEFGGDYDSFIWAFIAQQLEFDLNAKMVMQGKITPEELKAKNPDYYVKNIPLIKNARREYINSLPTPSILFNYYIGALASNVEGSQGRIGKSMASKVLAISLLAPDYPDVNFYEMTDDDLVRNGYIYWAGGDGVALQKYDGQKVIIWDDVRGYDLIKTFGGVSRLFDAFDTRPKPVPLNIKYGETYLKNSYNIITGTQTYQEFINELSVEFKDVKNRWGDVRSVKQTKEDRSQAKGRFPFFIEVTPSFITVNAQLDYLIGSNRYNFRRTFKNDLIALMANGKIQEASEHISGEYIAAQKVVLTQKEKPKLPEEPMRELMPDEVEKFAEKDGVILDRMVIEKAEKDEWEQRKIYVKKALKKHGYDMTFFDEIEDEIFDENEHRL